MWPKSGRKMKVAALRDALGAATAVSIPKGLEIPVVTIPGFVLTKIEAYRERRYSRPVDLPHVFACLKHYPDEDPEGLRYECAGVEVDGELVGYLEAGAWLVGQGILAIASAEPLAAVRRFLEAASDPYSPQVSQLVSPAAEESDRVRIARLFRVAGRGAGAG